MQLTASALIALLIVGFIAAGLFGFILAYGIVGTRGIYAAHTYTTTETTTWWTWSVTTFTDIEYYKICFLNTTLGWKRIHCPPDVDPNFPEAK